MSEEYPLYPELTEAGKAEAQEIMDRFKADLAKAMSACAEKATDDFYYSVIQHIESDSWTNYRNQLLDGLTNYANKGRAEHDFEKIRRSMFEQYRDEIVSDLNQDLIKQVADLKEDLNRSRY